MASNPYVNYVYNNRLPGWVNIQNPDVSRSTLDDSSEVTPEQRQSTYNAEGGVIPIVYGRQRVGSKLFAVRSYGGGAALALGCILCEGEVHQVESIEVNDTAIGDYTFPYAGTWYQSFVGTSDQTASSILTNAFAGSTPTYTDTLPNTCYAAILIPFGLDIQGFPRVSAIVKGCKVYDPRDANQNETVPSTWTFSDNPSLCLANLITSTRFGPGKKVNWDSVVEAANFNDKLLDGDPSRRLDIVIDTQQETGQWIETLRAYASVFLQLDGDTYTFIPDKPISNAFECKGAITCYGQISGSGTFTDFDLDSTKGFSFEVTVKPTMAAGQAGAIFAKGNFQNEDVAMYYAMPANTDSPGEIQIAYAATIAPAIQRVTFAETLPSTAYSTFSFGVRPDGNVVAAINGTEVYPTGADLVYEPVSFRNEDLYDYYFGKTGDETYPFPFAGIIDEFRFWRRFREIEEIWRYCRRPLKRDFDNSLSIHISFNEGYDAWSKASGATSYTASSIAKNTGYLLEDNEYPVTITNGDETWNVWHLFEDYEDGAFGQYDFYSFNNTNILDGSVKYRKRGVLGIPTVVQLGYTDMSNKPWREAYATVDESGLYGNKVRISKVSMPGITRYSQAEREAWERLHTNLNDLTVTFTALDDALNINLGDGIIMHHEVNEVRYTDLFKPYRVTGIRHKEWGKWDVTALEYDPQGYATTAGPTQTFTETNLPPITNPVAPASLNVVEEVFQNDTGVWTSRLRVTWAQPDYPYTSSYKIEVIRVSPTPQKLMETSMVVNRVNGDGLIEYVTSSGLNLLQEYIDGEPLIPPGSTTYPTYRIKVYTISVLGKASETPVEVEYEMQGKKLRPGNVPAIRGFEASGKVYLSWDKAVDLDIWRYHLKHADKTAVESYSTEVQWEMATTIDYIDALTYIATNIPIGDRRFLIKAVDSLTQESLDAVYVDIYVDRDDNAFIVGEISVTANSTACTNCSSYTRRPNPNVSWITDFGGTWDDDGDVLTAPIAGDALQYVVIPSTHADGISEWVSNIADFGAATSGTSTTYYTGNLVVTANLRSLVGTVNYFIEASTDLTTWTTAVGTSANMTARYVRFRVRSGQYDGTSSTSDTTSAFYIDNSILIRFDVVAREESGSVTTTAYTETSGTTTTTATYGLVELTRQYAKVKSIQLTLVNAGGFYIPTYEDVLVGHDQVPNSFKVIVIDAGNLQINGQEVSYLFKGV